MGYSVVRLVSETGQLVLEIADRGATWLSCEVDMGGGQWRDVILRRASIDDASGDKAFLGATVGRYANRIAHGRIARDGREWQLALAPGEKHHLHGGPGGFHTRIWDVEQVSPQEARFSLVSPDGDQGYPGELKVEVTYRLVGEMTIEMETRATATEATPVAITNHAYFNLDGDARDVRGHTLQVAASMLSAVDAELIPLGPPATVEATALDFRRRRAVAEAWLGDEQQRFAGGIDHAFLLNADVRRMARSAAELVSATGDLRLAIHTDLPALQVYSGQYLAGIATTGSRMLPACAGMALEPGYLPDSPGHPEWPQDDCWVGAGRTAHHRIRYAFDSRPASHQPPAATGTAASRSTA
jgi:aldose 1-epimerase